MLLTTAHREFYKKTDKFTKILIIIYITLLLILYILLSFLLVQLFVYMCLYNYKHLESYKPIPCIIQICIGMIIVYPLLIKFNTTMWNNNIQEI